MDHTRQPHDCIRSESRTQAVSLQGLLPIRAHQTARPHNQILHSVTSQALFGGNLYRQSCKRIRLLRLFSMQSDLTSILPGNREYVQGIAQSCKPCPYAHWILESCTCTYSLRNNRKIRLFRYTITRLRACLIGDGVIFAQKRTINPIARQMEDLKRMCKGNR